MNEIERRAFANGYLSLRRAKLPQTFGVIGPLIEETKAFQLRRLEYHFDRFCAEGLPLGPSKLLRTATLKSEWRETAAAMIHRASAGSRDQP